MAGTINLAFTQQFDMDGAPLSGGLLSFFTAGTTTPQSAFQDTGLTIVHPNPIVLDSSGRVPMFYLADGFIKIRLTDKNGVTVIAADQLLVIGPSSGGGGGGGSSSGDLTAALQTGDIKARYDTAVKDGFVRLNGLTIGNVGSSATERQESVCQPLFVYLWAFPNITLDGFAKGANALADFGAGRRLFLPDLRGRTIAGMDDMGTTAANRLTAAGLGVIATVLGNAGGAETLALTTAQLPAHAHLQQGLLTTATENQPHNHNQQGSFPSDLLNIDHSHNVPGLSTTGAASGGVSVATSYSGIGSNASGTMNSNASIQTSTTIGGITGNERQSHDHNLTLSGNTANAGSGSAHSSVLPTMVLTWYMKM